MVERRPFKHARYGEGRGFKSPRARLGGWVWRAIIHLITRTKHLPRSLLTGRTWFLSQSSFSGGAVGLIGCSTQALTILWMKSIIFQRHYTISPRLTHTSKMW